MKWYKLVFKQNQPIHIGSLNWGVINQTLIFVPGWTIWGALTKAYNMDRKQPLSENQELFEVITCFYPSFDENGNNPLFPEYKDGVFHLGKYPENKFRYEFTDTFVSTSILPESRGAKEESLHETEILLPGSKGENKKLYWVGILGINDSCQSDLNNFLKEGLKIYVGGDARYGLGELELVKKDSITNNNVDLKKWQITEDGMFDNSLLNELLNEGLKNFLEFSADLAFEGELILHAEFSFLQNLPQVKEGRYFITPGSKILNNINFNYKLKKGKFIKQGG